VGRDVQGAAERAAVGLAAAAALGGGGDADDLKGREAAQHQDLGVDDHVGIDEQVEG